MSDIIGQSNTVLYNNNPLTDLSGCLNFYTPNMQGVPLSPLHQNMQGGSFKNFWYIPNIPNMNTLLNSPQSNPGHIFNGHSQPQPQPQVSTQNQQQQNPHPIPISGQINPGGNDILRYLSNIDTKLTEVNMRLRTLDTVEKKIDDFDIELKKMRISFDKEQKATNDKLENLDTRTDNIDFIVGETQDRMTELENENSKLKDTILNLKSDSLRDTLIFGGLPEEQDETEQKMNTKLKTLMKQDLEMEEDIVNQMNFKEVRRLGQQRFG